MVPKMTTLERKIVNLAGFWEHLSDFFKIFHMKTESLNLASRLDGSTIFKIRSASPAAVFALFGAMLVYFVPSWWNMARRWSLRAPRWLSRPQLGGLGLP